MTRSNRTPLSTITKSFTLGMILLGTNPQVFSAEPANEPSEFLSELGLSSLEAIEEVQASEVRGQGVGSSGLSMLIGSLVDPATGSTANFFQIQSSGSTGAQAFHSNSINASFEWTVNGMLQRFQAEIGGFGSSFAR
jgi:hypothetical protein